MRFLLVFLLITANAFANDLCSKESILKDSINKQFKATSMTMTFGYAPLYKAVDRNYAEVLNEECKKGSSDEVLIPKLERVCLNVCDTHIYSHSYFKGPSEEIKKMQASLFKECANVCYQNKYALNLYSSALQENGCQNQTPASVNNSNELKEIKDRLENSNSKISPASKQ